MEQFMQMQQFALSWALVFLTAVFLIVVFWVFRPGGRKAQDDAATTIFRHEDRPAVAGEGARGTAGTTFKEARK